MIKEREKGGKLKKVGEMVGDQAEQTTKPLNEGEKKNKIKRKKIKDHQFWISRIAVLVVPFLL
jgi:hypothetical protein